MKQLKRRRLRALLAACMMAVSLLSSASVSTVSAATQSELEAQLKALEAQEKQLKKDLNSASSNLSASQERKKLLDSQIDNATQQIHLLDQQLAAINKSIEEKNAQIGTAQADIEAKEAAIADTHKALGLRLRAIAKTGNLSTIQRLLNTDNYTEYLLKSKAAECIAQRDQATMDALNVALEEIRVQKADLEAQKASIEAEQAEVKKLKSSSDAKKKELDTLHAAAQSEVRKLQSTVSSYNTQLKENQRKQEEADRAIAALIASTTSSGTFNGKLMYWPVPTVRNISSHFGPRWGTMHRGLDISEGAVPIYGQNIVAAADGVVIAVNSTSRYGTGWSYGYGYCVIVDHGRDSQGRTVHTMYAHCSKMFATVGQKVTGGKTVLAQAGNTGDVTGPHLHFEVRVDNIRINPYPNYVDPRYN